MGVDLVVLATGDVTGLNVDFDVMVYDDGFDVLADLAIGDVTGLNVDFDVMVYDDGFDVLADLAIGDVTGLNGIFIDFDAMIDFSMIGLNVADFEKPGLLPCAGLDIVDIWKSSFKYFFLGCLPPVCG